MIPVDPLFRPFALKSLAMPNRVVMAPMTRSFSPDGLPTDDVVAYYRRRAEGGVGLIVTEGTGIDRPGSLNDPKVPRFHGEAELAVWKRVVEAVHAAGGRIAPQLWHVGAVSGQSGPPLGRIDSPSGIGRDGASIAEPMTDADVADAIAAFGRAAGDARRLGFDAVELHGAHGYLIDQFFWTRTNRRADGYGGADIAARGRFAAEILKAVRAAVGPDFVVILRLSQWKIGDFAYKVAPDPKAMAAWLQPLADAGADIFHCSQRRFWEPEFEGSDLNFAGWAKKVTGTPTITVGSVGLNDDFINGMAGGRGAGAASLDELMARLDRGEFDLVAVGRALLQDPQWLAKVRAGEAPRDFERAALDVLY